MRKKVALTAAAVAMVGTLAVGGTLAWFTDTETATNVVTTGEVDITLSEDGGEDGTVGENGLTYTEVMPGDEFDKIVTIDNEGHEAWVRAIIEVSGDVPMNGEAPLIFKKDGVALDMIWNGPDDDGVYSAIITTEDGLLAEKDTWEVFDAVEVPTSWNNTYENCDFNIKVTAEAVQYENNEVDPWSVQYGGDLDASKSEANDAHGTIDGLDQ